MVSYHLWFTLRDFVVLGQCGSHFTSSFPHFDLSFARVVLE